MGTWGVGIYSNDTAEEVRDICNEIYPFVSIEEGNKIIFKEFEELIEADLIDNDYASFWYALADWQWKHGILSENIRLKAISLLENNAGLEEWEESGNQANLKKRIAVMEKLKSQLKSPIPTCKVHQGKVTKPKHKIGDVIIFRTCAENEDGYGNLWKIENVRSPFMFQEERISTSGDKIFPSFDAHDKYMAILCVGTEKIQHSPYLSDLFDEYSVYAYYDYVSQNKPTLSDLKMCGFLPLIFWSHKSHGEITDYIGWTYTFTLISETFRVSKNSAVKDFSRVNLCDEPERFYSMMEKKDYLTEVQCEFELYDAFSDCWEEKKRMDKLGITMDTLISENIYNPQFLAPEDIDNAFKKLLI